MTESLYYFLYGAHYPTAVCRVSEDTQAVERGPAKSFVLREGYQDRQVVSPVNEPPPSVTLLSRPFVWSRFVLKVGLQPVNYQYPCHFDLGLLHRESLSRLRIPLDYETSEFPTERLENLKGFEFAGGLNHLRLFCQTFRDGGLCIIASH